MTSTSGSAPDPEAVDGLTLAVGVVELARETLRGLRSREPSPPPPALAFAAGAVDRGADLLSGTLARIRATYDAAADALPPALRERAAARTSFAAAWRTAATERGTEMLNAGRAEAGQLVGNGVDTVLAWIQDDVAPRLVEGLLPYLTEEVVPKVVTELLPTLRAEILPVVISDLASSQELRDLVYQQSQGFVRESSDEVRRRSRRADDALEARVRRMMRLAPRPGNGATEPQPVENPPE